jgi:hypothetical protein
MSTLCSDGEAKTGNARANAVRLSRTGVATRMANVNAKRQRGFRNAGNILAASKGRTNRLDRTEEVAAQRTRHG